MKLLIDIIGIFAGIVNNISMYPLAYSIYKIKKSNELIKFENISIITHILQISGCSLWLIYSIYYKLYPLIFACILSIIPNSYIIIIVYNYRPTIIQNKNNILEQNDNDLNSIDNDIIVI